MPAVQAEYLSHAKNRVSGFTLKLQRWRIMHVKVPQCLGSEQWRGVMNNATLSLLDDPFLSSRSVNMYKWWHPSSRHWGYKLKWTCWDLQQQCMGHSMWWLLGQYWCQRGLQTAWICFNRQVVIVHYIPQASVSLPCGPITVMCNILYWMPPKSQLKVLCQQTLYCQTIQKLFVAYCSLLHSITLLLC